MARRVVVTGLGMISPLGHSVKKSWQAIKEGQCGIGKLTRYDATGHNVQIAAEVKDWDPLTVVTRKEVRRHDRYQLFGYGAAMEAIEEAGWAFDGEKCPRVSVVIGSSVGGVESFQEQLTLVYDVGDWRQVTPFGIPMLMANGASVMVGIKIGATGPSSIAVSACATGADSISRAFDLIRLGRVDRALTGCADAPIIPLGVSAFDRVRATSRRNDDPQGSMRPFSKDRDGLVFSEGAAVLALEELEYAKARGATILAELAGYGATSDAFHITAPEPEGIGASQAMQMAMDDAQINPEDVHYINAHGTATELNDPMETKAIKRVFGEHAYNIPVSSTKSMTGHGMGTTAAMEAVFSVLALRDQVMPPTINYTEPDPNCDLDYVPNAARDAQMDYVISNSFGFGGHNIALVFKKFIG